MKILAVVWTAYACAGGSCGAMLPPRAQPLLCRAVPALELYDPAREAEARRRVAALGDPAALYACRGVRCSAPLSSWNVIVTFKETPP